MPLIWLVIGGVLHGLHGNVLFNNKLENIDYLGVYLV